jgi:hypothetical protein
VDPVLEEVGAVVAAVGADCRKQVARGTPGYPLLRCSSLPDILLVWRVPWSRMPPTLPRW